MFKWHLKQAISQKETLIALLLMSVIMLAAFFSNVADCLRVGNDATEVLPAYSAFTLHNTLLHPFSMLYVLLIPLVSALPYGLSRMNEHNGRLDNILFSRISRRRYILSQAAAGACTGAFVAAFPLIINILLCLITFPLYTPRMAMGGASSMSTYDFFLSYVYLPQLYASRPYVYVLLSILGCAFFGGICALWGFTASMHFRKKPLIGVAVPFISLMLFSCIQYALTAFTESESFAALPFYFMMAEDSRKFSLPVFALMWLAITIFVIADLLRQLRNPEAAL